jgi:hypothetical protein
MTYRYCPLCDKRMKRFGRVADLPACFQSLKLLGRDMAAYACPCSEFWLASPSAYYRLGQGPYYRGTLERAIKALLECEPC